MKKKIWVLLIVFIFSISTFIFIRKITSTGYGRIDTMYALILKTNKYFNPNSIKGKSISEVRKLLDNDASRWSTKPIPFSNTKNMIITTSTNKIPVRIYTPKTGNYFPIVIYSHDGSFVGGSIYTHDNICRKLSKNANAIVISINYRLAPENPFPAALWDVYNILQWTYKNAESINGDGKHIAVAGDSAGGNLSAAVCLMARDKNDLHVDCQVLIYPCTNLYELNSKSWSSFSDKLNISKEDMEKFISLYIPKKEDRKNPYASPLLASDLKKLPDTLVITAEIDPLRDDGEEYGDKLKKAGIKVEYKQYKGVTHGFINMDKITNKADEAIKEISIYLQNEFNKN